MRPRRLPLPPEETTPPRAANPRGAPRAVAVYDWSRFGRHRLRVRDNVVLDTPGLTDAPAPSWIATLWPDQNIPGAWARQQWAADSAGGRGWRIPVELAAGDVVEFGADTTYPDRWYGIMDAYQPDQWATIQGPYDHPSDAYADAQRLLTAQRYLPALEPEPAPACVRLHRTSRHRHPRR